MEGIEVLGADLHGDFDGIGVALGDDADAADVADGDAFKGDWCAYLYAGRVIEVSAELGLMGERPSGGTGHEEDEADEHGHGNEDQCTNS